LRAILKASVSAAEGQKQITPPGLPLRENLVYVRSNTLFGQTIERQGKDRQREQSARGAF
jgi:hypothetical protein